MSLLLEDGGQNIVANAITTTGTQLAFAFSPSRSGLPRTLSFTAQGASGVMPTTVTANLQSSADGGTTWENEQTATGMPLVATSTGLVAVVTNCAAGKQYRLRVGTLTLGSAASVTIYCAVN